MKNRLCVPELAGVCGTSIDTGDVDFTGGESNLVFLDKVFSFNKATACPLLFNLNTCMHPDKFDVKFICADKGCGCGCNPCDIEKNAVFEIEKAFGILDFIEVKPPGNISPAQVTIDGEEVDSVEFENGRYLVNVSSLNKQLQKEICEDVNLPTKNFFLIKNVGPFEFRATFIIEGKMFSGGRVCCFKAEISNDDDEPGFCLPSHCCSSFAIPDLPIPCTTNGNAPDIRFHFTGKVKLVNPELKVVCGTLPGIKADGIGLNTELFEPGTNGCTVCLKSTLVVEPSVQVEVVRRTLFIINAREGVIPCQDDVAALQIERKSRKDACNNVSGCGFIEDDDRRDRDNHDDRDDRDDVRGERDRRNHDDVRGIRDICDFHDDREDIGDCPDICRCGKDRDRSDVRSARDECECNDDRDDVGGIRDFCDDDDVSGRRSRRRRKDVCSCIDFEERGCNDACGCDRGCGCGCDDRGRGRNNDKRNDRERTAFQFNGCNGCSW